MSTTACHTSFLTQIMVPLIPKQGIVGAALIPGSGFRRRVPAFRSKAHGQAQYSQEQLEFLQRKSTGTMPGTCRHCSGTGMVSCSTCSGTGANQQGVAERLFGSDDHAIKSNAPDLNVHYLFMDEMPCFICKGQTQVPCSQCAGTGISDFEAKFAGGD